MAGPASPGGELPTVKPWRDTFMGQQLLERVGVLYRGSSETDDGCQRERLGHCFAIQPNLILTTVSAPADKALSVVFPKLNAEQISITRGGPLWQSEEGTLALLQIEEKKPFFQEEASLHWVCLPETPQNPLVLQAFPSLAESEVEDQKTPLSTSVLLILSTSTENPWQLRVQSEGWLNHALFHGVPCFLDRNFLGLARWCTRTESLFLECMATDALTGPVNQHFSPKLGSVKNHDLGFPRYSLAFFDVSPRQKKCSDNLVSLLSDKIELRKYLSLAMSELCEETRFNSDPDSTEMARVLLEKNLGEVFFLLRSAVKQHYLSLKVDEGNPNQFNQWKKQWRPRWARLIKLILINDLNDDWSRQYDSLSQVTPSPPDMRYEEMNPSTHEDAVHQLNLIILHLMEYEGDLQLRRDPHTNKIYVDHGFISSHMPVRDGGSQHRSLGKFYLFNSVLRWLEELKDPGEAGWGRNLFCENLSERELVDIKAEIETTISNIKMRDKITPFFHYDHSKPWGYGIPLVVEHSPALNQRPDHWDLGSGVTEAALGELRKLFPDLAFYQDDGRLWRVRIFRTVIGSFVTNLAALVETLNHPAAKKNQGTHHA